jgi:predicted AAA+ superfamily ATPase
MFDVGVTNYLLHRSRLRQGSPEYGHAFEHLIIQEIIAYLGYQGRQSEISYWRTGSGVKIDVVLVEFKILFLCIDFCCTQKHYQKKHQQTVNYPLHLVSIQIVI